MKNKEIIRITENLTLLNILAPIGGIEYYKNYFRVGDYLGRVYAITIIAIVTYTTVSPLRSIFFN